MFNYSRQSSTPCWNGVNCFYLKNRRCHFYHPPEHFQPTTTIQNRSNIRPSSIFNSSLFERRVQPPVDSLTRLRQRLRAQQEARRIRDQEQRRRREAQQQRQTQNRLLNLFLRLRQQRAQRQQLRNNNSSSFSWFFGKNNTFNLKQTSPQMLKKLQNFNQCPICFQDYLQNSQKIQVKEQKKQVAQEKQKCLVQLFCSHIYHKECIQNWLKKNQKCAVCRKDFREHQAYKEWDSDYKKRFKSNQQGQRLGIFNYPIISPSIQLTNTVLLPFRSQSDQEQQWAASQQDQFSDNYSADYDMYNQSFQRIEDDFLDYYDN